MQDFIKINDRDNVIVVLRDLRRGEILRVPAGGRGNAACGGTQAPGADVGEHAAGKACGQGAGEHETEDTGCGKDACCGEAEAAGGRDAGLGEITVLEDIPLGHKMAVCPIPEGGQVIKYGYRIGYAKEPINAGAWIHTHNLGTALGELLEYTYEPVFPEDAVPSGAVKKGGTFLGFRRPDGRAGVRNEIWIIPTVGCVNNVASAIAAEANRWLGSTEARGAGEKVEEVIAFPHPYGCSQMGEDQEHTRQILADLVNHPNAGGVLVLGLGCENSNVEVLKPYIGGYDGNRVKFLVCQECEDETGEALEIIKELVGYASRFERQPMGLENLVVGMKCGGSDGLSGITANPLVGHFSDELIARRGTTILTEVPEMFGAETILMNRCADGALFRQTVALINDFKNYFTSHNQTIYENPSPGNKKGGISTLEDKSLGCTQKSGSAPVKGVLRYGERVKARGLNLLSAPGNDLVAATALAAAGAQIVLFTTGRGTPFASPVPTVKISTNSALAEKKAGWIDFNAGVLAEDGGMEEEAEALFDYVCQVASGRKVRSEEAGYHDMAIFKQGVTL